MILALSILAGVVGVILCAMIVSVGWWAHNNQIRLKLEDGGLRVSGNIPKPETGKVP